MLSHNELTEGRHTSCYQILSHIRFLEYEEIGERVYWAVRTIIKHPIVEVVSHHVRDAVVRKYES